VRNDFAWAGVWKGLLGSGIGSAVAGLLVWSDCVGMVMIELS